MHTLLLKIRIITCHVSQLNKEKQSYHNTTKEKY